MNERSFNIDGVRFNALATWRYVVVYRYVSQPRASVQPWEGFTSFEGLATALRVFEWTRTHRGGGGVWLVDTIDRRQLMRAWHGTIELDVIHNGEPTNDTASTQPRQREG